jgi:hypothetical protein
LFFSFVWQIGFGMLSLAQEISSVIHYLPCFRERLTPTCCQSSLPFLCLFTDRLVLRLAPCTSPFSSAGSAFRPPPLLSMFDYSSLFVIQFCWWGDQSAQGLC